jgi:S-adenosylmethionine:tRNA ribosyltransferase-isomerase
MDDHQLSTLNGRTSIYILPGYAFRVCKGLITNFHQPGSTLLLLIAAFAGEDWKSVYREALANDYRFLSYGDSSLLLPGPTTSGTGS